MNRSNWILIAFAFIVLLLAGYGFKNQLDSKVAAYESVSQDVLVEGERIIYDLLNGLRTGSDSYSQAVKVSDCRIEERARFDELLSNLATLGRTEVVELDELFNSCAYYFATVQTVSVARLEREVAMYNDILRVSAVLDEKAAAKLEQVPIWEDIVAKEKERGMLHNQLVAIQGDIVDELLEYKQVGHPDIQLLITEANEVRENIVYLTQQIDELVASLEDHETTS